MFPTCFAYGALLLLAGAGAESPDRTCFQVYPPYSPELDCGSDVAIVYGAGPTFPERSKGWRDHGYAVSLMTGIAWGDYGAYYGDGEAFKKDEVQTLKDGRLRMHGDSTNVGYNVPTDAYIAFVNKYIDPALDAGVKAVYLEEPEYWANTGWSAAFKKEWHAFYGEPWQEPDSSPDAQYRASKLKYELYFKALREVFAHVDERGKGRGETIECVVPTHSLINYAQWRIVSPESHLIDIPQLDGYVAQVWTGTARSQNVYGGVRKERTFETAFLEYGQMLGMVRPTGKKVWFLHDPVEDNPNRSWNDYRFNYECTVVASLMWPEVARFEVMPWPNRIFQGNYAPTDLNLKTGERAGIPTEYATELLTIMNALNDMDQSDVRYETGSRGIGVIVSDTMMFQRAEPTPSEPMLSSFYGLALPFVKAGVPIEPVQLENVGQAGALDRYSVLLLTYEHQKPLKAAYHDALVAWVKAGGALLFVDDGKDPYNGVREWWNDQGARPAKPCEDLLKRLGVGDAVWNAIQPVEKGFVRAAAESPAALANDSGGPEHVRGLVKDMLAAKGQSFTTSTSFCIRRGPYVIASALDETPTGTPGKTLDGKYINLFDSTLAVSGKVTLAPNERAFLYDVEYGRQHAGQKAAVLAASARIREQSCTTDKLVFTARGPKGTPGRVRVLLPAEPKSVTTEPLGDVKKSWDPESFTALIEFPNVAQDVRVTVGF